MLLNKFIRLTIFSVLILAGSWNCDVKQKDSPNSSFRIISLAPHITEIIYAIGAQENLIAVTDFCKYPEEAKAKQKVGGLLNPNIELIIALKPTHIFGMPSHEKLDQELKKFGLNITMMSNENISDVLNSIKQIGQTIGYDQKARKLVDQISTTFDLLQKKSIQRSGISAALIIGREKGTLRNITVAGDDTFLDEIWQLCGGINVYNDMPIRYGTISLESLLMKDPDVIIEFELEGEYDIRRIDNADEWKVLNNLSAAKNQNIFVISGNHTLIPGPRMTLLAEDFTRIIEKLYSLNAIE